LDQEILHSFEGLWIKRLWKRRRCACPAYRITGKLPAKAGFFDQQLLHVCEGGKIGSNSVLEKLIGGSW
jgi:hypothetical protein